MGKQPISLTQYENSRRHKVHELVLLDSGECEFTLHFMASVNH